jgi:uncharacterized protein
MRTINEVPLATKRKLLFKRLHYFLGLNFLLTLIISYQYILNVFSSLEAKNFFYLNISLCSNFIIIYFALFILLSVFILLFPNKKAFTLFSSSLLLFFHLTIILDVILFRMFKFHINGLVMEFVLTEGSVDSIHINILTYLTAFLLIGIMVFLQFVINKKVNKIVKKERSSSYKKRIVIYPFLLSLLFILADKIVYAYADLKDDVSIMKYNKLFPLYQPLTIKKLAEKKFNYKEENLTTELSNKDNSLLNYPLETFKGYKNQKKSNIVLIVLDSWRYDMLNDSVTPNIYNYSKKAYNFTNHYSGGNGTGFGIFSLLYGIYGSYLHQFIAERKGSAFIDELLKLNYDMKVVSSTKLTYPELRKSAFIRIGDKIIDNINGDNSNEKDGKLTEDFLNYLDNRNKGNPFFAFLFYDSPHSPYPFPDSVNKFQPSEKSVNYLTINSTKEQLLKNSYKNASYFTDKLVEKVIKRINNDPKLKENTIVIITADHGEEFFEHGYQGHTGAFTDEQIKVPFIMYVPGYKPYEINYLTSHIDVVPTLLTLLGSQTNISSYSQGEMLLQHDKRKSYVISAGWNNAAIIMSNYKILFSTESYNSNVLQVMDRNYQQIPSKNVFTEDGQILNEVIMGIGKFIQ